jgi:hypothetical protein
MVAWSGELWIRSWDELLSLTVRGFSDRSLLGKESASIVGPAKEGLKRNGRDGNANLFGGNFLCAAPIGLARFASRWIHPILGCCDDVTRGIQWPQGRGSVRA